MSSPCTLGVEHYNEIRHISICEFLPPHLNIYVDVPAEAVQKRLKQSGKVAKATLLINPVVDLVMECWNVARRSFLTI